MTEADSQAGADAPSGSSEATATSLTEGARFGDLTLIREIGRGAQGLVFEGHQESVGRTVAVKILPKEVSFTEEQAERFHREAEAAGRLTHPNIVAVFGLEETGGHLFLLQELVGGGDLVGELKRRESTDQRVDPHECTWAAATCKVLAEALQHAHDHGVIHRDIKPANVLLTEEGAPKLTDFGLARMEDKLGLSQTGAVMGTPDYMSPEQVTAKPSEIDGRTDVYSLGAMLYRMLSRRVPFKGQSLQGLFLDILTRAPQPLRKLQPGVNADLEAVCLKALEKSPSDRYETAGDFAADLGRYLAGEPTVARPVSVFGRAARSLRRMATSTLAVVALLVPTAWIALDALALLPLARADADLHKLRLGVVAAATLLLAWPLSLLGVRLARGLARGAIPAWVLAVAAGTGAGFWVVEQGLEQRHFGDREVLAERIRLETAGDRLDVDDLTAYVASWQSRFAIPDIQLMAQGYLKRERPVEADSWTRRFPVEDTESPVYHALVLAISHALGDDINAAAAEARLWQASDDDEGSAVDWELTGDILGDLKRHTDARRAYLQAARSSGADRDRINLALARNAQSLCRTEDVREHLDDFMKWNPDDAQANLLACNLDIEVGDWDAAEEHFARYEATTRDLLWKRVENRYSLERQRPESDAAWRYLERVAADHADDVQTLAWISAKYHQEGTLAMGRAKSWSAYGDQDQAKNEIELARTCFAASRMHYDQLLEVEPESLAAEVGFVAYHVKMADLEAESREEHLDQALRHAARALELDPAYWQAHYNVGHAQLRARMNERGGLDELTLEDLTSYADHMRRSLEANGLQPRTLNNLAYILGKHVYARSGEEATLVEALSFATRAARLTELAAADGGECPPSWEERVAHSSHCDTLRELHEIAGNGPEALAAARAARDALPFDEPSREQRQAVVDRLEGLVETEQ